MKKQKKTKKYQKKEESPRIISLTSAALADLSCGGCRVAPVATKR